MYLPKCNEYQRKQNSQAAHSINPVSVVLQCKLASGWGNCDQRHYSVKSFPSHRGRTLWYVCIYQALIGRTTYPTGPHFGWEEETAKHLLWIFLGISRFFRPSAFLCYGPFTTTHIAAASQVVVVLIFSYSFLAIFPVWVRGCRIGPLRFQAGWRKRRLNQAFSFVLVQLDCACVRLLLVSITFVCMCM